MHEVEKLINLINLFKHGAFLCLAMVTLYFLNRVAKGQIM